MVYFLSIHFGVWTLEHIIIFRELIHSISWSILRNQTIFLACNPPPDLYKDWKRLNGRYELTMVLVVRMRNPDGSRWLEGCRDSLWCLNLEVVFVNDEDEARHFLACSWPWTTVELREKWLDFLVILGWNEEEPWVWEKMRECCWFLLRSLVVMKRRERVERCLQVSGVLE